MSQVAAPDRLRSNEARVLSKAFVLPSWVLSIGFHVVLLYVVGTTLKSCDSGSGGLGGENFRQVGLYVKAETAQDTEITPTQPPTRTTLPAPNEAPAELPAVDKMPPGELLLPPTQQFAIGPGGPPAQYLSDPQDTLLKSTESSLSAGFTTAASGGVAFFGVKDQGTRVVYVVDRSGSMGTHEALRFAKRELIASLQGLDANQEFQIIFYNNAEPLAMTGRDGRADYFWATEINRTLARQFIDSIGFELGTNHFPALIKALRMKPDVVYFLTDSGEPELDPDNLAQIRKLNQGRARIHCIEFGMWSNLVPENFLKKLARENGGTYTYRDVTKFEHRETLPR